jgi:hypothetical protein
VSPRTLTLCRPLISLDLPRDAYVLRVVGQRMGPVLREDRRDRPGIVEYPGPERRRALPAAQSDRDSVAV